MWHRNWISVGAFLIFLPTIALNARAEPYSKAPGNSTGLRTWCTSGTGCNDTWNCREVDSRKQQPFTPCYSPRARYDDYCKKALPCTPHGTPRGYFDDYCKKSCPVRLW
jgi:hypothetical protein